MVEASIPLLWLGLAWALGWGWTLVPMLWFVPVAVIVGVIDLRTLMVPTKLVWPAVGISVVLIAASAAGLGETAVVVGAALGAAAVSYTHLRAHEAGLDLVCRLLLEKKQ